MTPRRLTLVATFVGTALVAAPMWTGQGPRFIWNTSASVPIGLYGIEPAREIDVADLVAVVPPNPLAEFLAERGYLARNVTLIKRVLAVSGTVVCRQGTTIIAYDHAYGEARDQDALGRPLPSWQGCRQLDESEVFLMNWDASDSFDGRYFGPLPISSITARVIPVWTDETGDGRFHWRTANPVPDP